MIEDEVIREVRAIREAYARSHGFNIRAIVADLDARDSVGDWPVVTRPPRRPKPAQTPNPGLPGAVAAIPQPAEPTSAAEH